MPSLLLYEASLCLSWSCELPLQIVVPLQLADVLKAYTKEIIRRQPEDLLDFSAK